MNEQEKVIEKKIKTIKNMLKTLHHQNKEVSKNTETELNKIGLTLYGDDVVENIIQELEQLVFENYYEYLFDEEEGVFSGIRDQFASVIRQQLIEKGVDKDE